MELGKISFGHNLIQQKFAVNKATGLDNAVYVQTQPEQQIQQNVPVNSYQANFCPYIDNNKTYTKLENKVIDGKEYNQYRLNNGTVLLLKNIPELKNVRVSTGITPDKSLFKNNTEEHLFEHMFCGNNQPVSVGFNNGGKFVSLNDGPKGQQVCFDVVTSDDDLKSVIEEQTKVFYQSDFSPEIFDREKQALNIELAIKTKPFGNREEIDSIDLNHLRQIRNQSVKSNNMEIMVEGNINPDELTEQISTSSVNINPKDVVQLQDVTFQNGQVSKSQTTSISISKNYTKPENMDEVTFQTTLEAIKLLSVFSDKTDFNNKTRSLCYGGNARVEKNDQGYSIVYDNETLNDMKSQLETLSQENIDLINSKPFTEQDVENVKQFIKNAPDYMFSDYLVHEGRKQAVLDNIDNLTLENINSVIENSKNNASSIQEPKRTYIPSSEGVVVKDMVEDNEEVTQVLANADRTEKEITQLLSSCKAY